MKRVGLKSIIVISSLMALFGCSSTNNENHEMSFSFKGFETASKKPFAYLEENMEYVPVTVKYEKGKGQLDIKEFSLSSTNPISIFKDLNNNKILDEDEKGSLKEIGKEGTSIDWIDDVSNSNKDDVLISANYMLYKENGFIDGTVVTYVGMEIVEGSKDYKTIESDSPSSIVLLYDKPEEHLVIRDTPKQGDLYNTDVIIRSDDVLRILSVSNATHIEGDTYNYRGLDGEIIIKYAVNIKDPYYSGKNVNFGEGEYKYKVTVSGHNHNVSSPTKVSAMNVYSCACDVFEAYELDSLNALDPTEPDLNNPAEMMGNQMFRIEWNVKGIKKGRYKVYVHGSTKDSQSNLKWFTREDNASSHCPSYIRIGETEKQPCTDKTFGETFGNGTGWRWTSDYIFDVTIPEDLEMLSIQSGNNNGRLNDYNMFVRGLLLVPFGEDFSPNNL